MVSYLRFNILTLIPILYGTFYSRISNHMTKFTPTIIDFWEYDFKVEKLKRERQRRRVVIKMYANAVQSSSVLKNLMYMNKIIQRLYIRSPSLSLNVFVCL